MLEKTKSKGPGWEVQRLSFNGPLFFLPESPSPSYWPRFLKDHGRSSRTTSVALISDPRRGKLFPVLPSGFAPASVYVCGGGGEGGGSSCNLSNTLALLLNYTHSITFLWIQVAKLKFKPAFAEKEICWKYAKEPPDMELGQAGTGAALGPWDFNLTGLPSLLVSASLCLRALLLQSGGFSGGRNQGHQQLLAHIFLFCHERAKGLSLLVLSWNIPENDSG